MCSYGDFVALSDVCDAATATLIKREVSDGVIAPGYTDEALEILKDKRKGTYNVIKIDPDYVPEPIERKQVFGITVEQARKHSAFIRQCMQSRGTTAARPLCGDALRFIGRCHEKFNFIFADPPYALPELPELPDRVMQSDMLADDALFVLEHGARNDFSQHPCFVEHRAYGSVNFSFFKKRTAE